MVFFMKVNEISNTKPEEFGAQLAGGFSALLMEHGPIVRSH